MLYSLDTCNTNLHNKNMVKYIHNQQINIKYDRHLCEKGIDVIMIAICVKKGHRDPDHHV
jgi:hypothetical protein